MSSNLILLPDFYVRPFLIPNAFSYSMFFQGI